MGIEKFALYRSSHSFRPFSNENLERGPKFFREPPYFSDFEDHPASPVGRRGAARPSAPGRGPGPKTVIQGDESDELFCTSIKADIDAKSYLQTLRRAGSRETRNAGSQTPRIQPGSSDGRFDAVWETPVKRPLAPSPSQEP